MKFKIEEGALLEVPCYESHSRGKNWFAVIGLSPSSPGGISREFQPKARGEYYYMVDGLSAGQAVEFGADYYTTSGRPNRKRFYGVITSLTPDCLEVEEYETARQAVKAAKEFSLKEGAVA